MRPYGKTFRVSKIHKSTECRLCSEDVSGGAKHKRKESKDIIKEELDIYLDEKCKEELSDETWQNITTRMDT